MELADCLKLERYKLVTERQRYFTDLAKDSFASYIRMLAGLSAVAVAVVSARQRLELQLDTVLFLVKGILVLLTFLGVSLSIQIGFCLMRWYGFRCAESDINPDAPKPDRWWWVFEVLYVVAIAFSIGLAWCMFAGLSYRLSQVG